MVSAICNHGEVRAGLPWQEGGQAPDGQQKSRGHTKKSKDKKAKSQGVSTGRTLIIFGVGALVTLVCGVLLESSGEAIAITWA